MSTKKVPYTSSIIFAAEYISRLYKEYVRKIVKEENLPISYEEYIILDTVYFYPGSIQMEIVNKQTKLGNPCFCLLCSGFVPPDIEPYNDLVKYKESSDTFYSNLYGKFLTFDKCLTEYYRVVSWLVEYKDNPLFDV